MMVRAQTTRPLHLLPVLVAFGAVLLVAASGAYWEALPAIAVATWVACAWIGRWSFRLPLRLARRDLDFESCEHCGHWLRGLPASASNCPECGQPVERVSPFVP